MTAKTKRNISLFLKLTMVFAVFFTLFVTYDWWVAIYSILGLIMMVVPVLVLKKFQVVIPISFEFVYVIFIYASMFLGEAHNFYYKFEHWDKILHILSGLLIAYLGFLIIYLFFLTNKIKTSPFIIAIFTFCAGLALGALWEIFEYFMDVQFGFNMQKSGLVDTMGDIIVDTIGSLVGAILAYIFTKYNNKSFFSKMTKEFLENNPQFK